MQYNYTGFRTLLQNSIIYTQNRLKNNEITYLKLMPQSLNFTIEKNNNQIRNIEYNMMKKADADIIIKNFEKKDKIISYVELRHLMKSLNLISRHFTNNFYDYEYPNINPAFREEDAPLIAKKIFYSPHLQSTINQIKQEINQKFYSIVPYLATIYPYLKTVDSYDCQYGHYNLDQIILDHALIPTLKKG